MRNINIEYVAVANLTGYAKNPRTHSKEQIQQLCKSIQEFGWTNPILIDESNTIIAGHGRLEAAKKLGIEQVPTIALAGLSEAQKRALVIADNKLALNAGWDEAVLTKELQALADENYDALLTGFSQDELDELLKEAEVLPVGDEEAVPKPPEEPITKLGDVWILGNHRLMCGDSTSIDAVDLLMAGERADICFTSPPYNASVVITDGKHDKKYQNYSDDLSADDYCDFLISFTNISKMICEYCFINIQSLSNNKKSLIEYLYKNKDSFADYIIWDKCAAEPAMAHNVLNSQFEFVYVFSSKANRAIGTIGFRGTLSNIISLPSRKDKEFSSIHKATFPVSFAEYFVANFAKKSVYDPFGGSGTTLIACEKLHRHARLMELDPKYCDVIVKRWEDFTGKKAVLCEQ